MSRDKNPMPATAVVNKFEIKFPGPDVREAVTELPPEKTEAIRNLGIATVPMLLGVLDADPRAFADALNIERKDIQAFKARLTKVAGAQIMTAAQRDKLMAIPCSLGFDIEKFPPLKSLQGEGVELLELKGLKAPPINTPGHDLFSEMPSIRNQGDRGTCVAHSVARCYEHQEHKVAGNPGANSLDYSEQFLYWVTKSKDGAPNEEGTWIENAADVIVNDGICKETTMPYVATTYPNDPAQKGPKPSSAAFSEARGHRADQAEKIVPRDVDALKTMISNGLVVAYAIPVFRSWFASAFTRATGFVTMPVGSSDPIEGGHAFALTGWGIDSKIPGGGYFIFDNSWSTDWGAQNQFGAGRGILPFKYAQNFGTEAWAFSFD
jgi:hypothetical protein